MHINRPMDRFRRMIWPLIGRGAGHGRESMVCVGDCFEEQEDGHTVWVIERITHVRVSPFPLVDMRRRDRPEMTRTLSISALLDSEEYRKLSSDSAQLMGAELQKPH